MKHLSILLSVLFIATISYTQEARFGFTVSPTFGFANIEPSDDATYYDEDRSESKTGVVYGAMLDYDFNGNDRYFIHSGIMLHHTGFKTAGYEAEGGINTTFENDINVNYIEIPLILKLKTNSIGYLRYYGQFGLNNDIKIGEKIVETDISKDHDFNTYKTFNTGLNMGGGIEYNFSPETSAVAGVYFNNGFSKVADNAAGTIKQNQLGIRLGVYF